MNWRCANDPFGYCKKEPDWEIEPVMTTANDPMQGKCKLEPKTCKHYLTFTQPLKK